MLQLLDKRVSVDNFLPHVMANAIGDEKTEMLPENAARSFIINSAIKFSERSGILKRKIKIDLQCGLDTYPIEIADCETVIMVEHAQYSSFCAGPDDFFSSGSSCCWSWGDVRFSMEDDTLHINPAPTKDIKHGLELKLIVAPKRDACEVDVSLYDKWYDAIVNGALYNIHMMPNRPWSSMSRADYYKRMFDEDVSRATIRDTLHGVSKPLMASPNPDFITCRRRTW